MYHKVDVAPEIRELVQKQRGRQRIFTELDPKKTALVVIDMQNFFFQGVPTVQGIVPNINRLAKACREVGSPVIWVVSYHEPDGSTWSFRYNNFFADPRGRASTLARDAETAQLHPDLDVHPDDPQLVKLRFGAMNPNTSELPAYLESKGIDTLIITGTRTSICCDTTAREAMAMDYRVLFVRDATADINDEIHQTVLGIILMAFGDVVTTDEVIASLKGNPAPAAG